MNETLIEVSGVTKHFGPRMALRGINLQLRAGQILALAGPNGSGKTTLLKILAGLLRPTTGRFVFSASIPANSACK